MKLTTHIDNVRIVLGRRLTPRKLTVSFGRNYHFASFSGWLPSTPDLVQTSAVMGPDTIVMTIWREMQYELDVVGRKIEIPAGNEDVQVDGSQK
jgi:hypothetical protein